LSKLSIIFKEWRVMNRWILIRHLKQILEYLASSYGNTIIINLSMGKLLKIHVKNVWEIYNIFCY
jgi:hypothetical protein